MCLCQSTHLSVYRAAVVKMVDFHFQSKLQDYKHWTSALCAVSAYLSAFAQCQIILLDDTDSGVQESAQREVVVL